MLGRVEHDKVLLPWGPGPTSVSMFDDNGKTGLDNEKF